MASSPAHYPSRTQRVNEIQSGIAATKSASTSDADEPADDKDIPSSKPKKKKGLEKLNPF